MVDITQLLSEAGAMLAVGMGVVFTFLTVLVFCIHAMSKLIQRYYPEPVPATAGETQPITVQTDPAVVAAVTVAVHAYRSRHNKN